MGNPCQLAQDGWHGFLGIGQAFLKQIFSFNSLSTQGFIVINLGLIGAWAIIKYLSHHENDLLKLLGLLDLITILYYFSLLGMYLLSMPFAEAITLDGFERYMSTIVVLNLFIGMMYLTYLIDETYYEQNIAQRSPRNFKTIWTKNGYQLATFLVMFFAIIMMYSEINGTNFTNNYNRRTLPVLITKIAQPGTKLNDKKILIVDPQKVEVTTYYAGYLANYYFFTNNSTGQAVFSHSKTKFQKDISQYEYVAYPKKDKTFIKGVKKTYHQSIKPGFYKVYQNHLEKIEFK